MAVDILEELKRKEEAMEALINDAKKRASAIREASLKSAKELKAVKLKDIEAELSLLSEASEKGLKHEISSIEEAGKRDAEALKKKGEANREKAIEEVMRTLTGGGY
ncbi:MAG: hypothetical protein HYV24_13085 [Deltaproteobacteria bacterium]|nr:hypothetical protein [Deltaproteobacteria bacterium]